MPPVPVLQRFRQSLTKFHQQIGFVLDINNRDHRVALFEWLNSWGCRQFAKKDHKTASRSLVAWGKDYIDKLPPEDADLLELTEVHLNSVAQAYGALKDRTASTRSGKSVGFGPAGTAKVLFAFRPRALPPWDAQIRQHFQYDVSPDSYHRFLSDSQNKLRELVSDAARFGIKPSDIPKKLNRPNSSLSKLVDEYNWVVITKKVKPPCQDELKCWIDWALK